MITYQDLLAVGDRDSDKMDFVRSAINWHMGSDLYKTAKVADLYDRKLNPDINEFTKFLYTVAGRQIPDTYSTNYKVSRAFFPFFIKQENQYLLSNGVTWENEGTSDKLGDKRHEFDTQLQDLGHAALSGAVSFGFWNLDHVDAFTVLEFAPLFDEENGSLRAGIRFWQIDAGKPFRATLYEEDGYTEYIWNRRKVGDEVQEIGEVLSEKRKYKIHITGTDVDGAEIYQGENYPSFPIVPFWANKQHQSEIVGIREQIFVYDVIKSGFCNNVEEASYIYWAIRNAPGMDDVDLAEFLQKMRTLHVAITEDNGSTAEPNQIEAPYQARETLLARLERDLFKDAMAFDPETIASGAITATQIRAAYENLELKVNDYEYCVVEFVNRILELAGIDDNPTFTRSKNVNTSEEIQTLMMCAQALPMDYVIKKILTLLGDGDQAEAIIQQAIADEMERQQEAMAQMLPDGNSGGTSDGNDDGGVI